MGTALSPRKHASKSMRWRHRTVRSRIGVDSEKAEAIPNEDVVVESYDNPKVAAWRCEPKLLFQSQAEYLRMHHNA